MSKPWGGIGASWADEAERADEEQSFPSLKEAATSTKSKKKKKMTLSEFTKGAGSGSVGMTREQMIQLPTGPRQRSEDEMQRGSYGSGGGLSKADEIDNWGAGKSHSSLTKSSTFGSGPEPDRWARGVSSGVVQEERRRLVLEPRKVVVDDSGVSETQTDAKTSKPSPFGAARPREQVLAEKGLDWKKLDSDIEAKKGSSQTSAQSSRPSSSQSNRSESLASNNNVEKPRPKVNPFGDAKPREVLLEEQGKDWRKMDSELEHRSVDRPETEEERLLKGEIEELRKKLEKGAAIAPESKETQQESDSDNHNLLREKEKDLELLIRELDDKVRFRPRAAERPGSGAGRTGSNYGERPHSRGGSVDESRSVESSMERPRSRGAGGGDDRRNFQGSKERGFFSNRNFDRSSTSRNGW